MGRAGWPLTENAMDQRRNGAESDALLPELPFAAAQEQHGSLLDELRAVLRVPFIDTFWLALLSRPELAERCWRWLAPLLGSVQCEAAARLLRQEAAIELALGLPAHKAFRGDMSRTEIDADGRGRISNYTAAAHYVLPKLLLAAMALRQEALRQPQPARQGALDPLPRGVIAGIPGIMPLDPDAAYGELPGIFAAIRAAEGFPQINAYFRTVALAGDFLRIAWNALKPVVGDPLYDERIAALVARAREQADMLRAYAEPLDLGAADAKALLPTLTFYAETLLPRALVEVTVVKSLIDGPDSAIANIFSLAPDEHATGA
jgi:hypothetical protein